MVALGSRSDDSFTESNFFSKFVVATSDNKNCKTPNTSDALSVPNSNAFLDLNGDCVPELVLTRTGSSNNYYEIYQQVFVDDKSMYCLAKQDGQLIAGTEAMPFIEFADFNRDGMTDMAFASKAGVLTVLYNQYTSPGPKSTNLCNDVGDTSKMATDEIFPSFGSFTPDNKNVLMYDLGNLPANIVY